MLICHRLADLPGTAAGADETPVNKTLLSYLLAPAPGSRAHRE